MTDRRRAVFLGSGAFGVPTLEALATASACTVVAVVSAPPRPAGRRGLLTPTPVQARAEVLGLPTVTPDRLRSLEVIEELTRLSPDLLVLADYGQIVPPAILALPANGALNLHPSLLPRHRGASPIAATILAGDAETGVTLMVMDDGLDTGPTVARVRLALTGTETAPALEGTLAAMAADLLAASIAPWLDGSLRAVPQSTEGVTVTRPLRRDDGRLDPALGVVRLERGVRAYQPWPGTWFDTGHGRIVVWAAQAVHGAEPHATSPDDVVIGLVEADGEGLAIVVADGRLRLLEVQPAGGRRMSAADLVRGRPGLVGSRLAAPSLG
ncbi:MAG: methionyl-tRNA formyltransferase [Candidatus Limnocylindrales bacterium]